jgi:predicted alpha/beta hydrolase family esterase
MNAISRFRRKRMSRPQREQWVAQFLQSNLSQREFAQAHGLGLSSLQRWAAQSRGKAGAGELTVSSPQADPVFVEIKGPPASPRWAAEVVRPNGSILRLAHDVPAVMLQSLLAVC